MSKVEEMYAMMEGLNDKEKTAVIQAYTLACFDCDRDIECELSARGVSLDEEKVFIIASAVIETVYGV